MARYLLDTDAVIDFLKGVLPSMDLVKEIHGRGDDLCVCDIVVAEVYGGLPPTPSQEAAEFLERCRYLTTGRDTARQAGQWRNAYRARGRVLSITDALIAATAREHQAIVVTGDAALIGMQEISVLPLPRSSA